MMKRMRTLTRFQSKRLNHLDQKLVCCSLCLAVLLHVTHSHTIAPRPIASFPARKERSVSDDDGDYAVKSHKRKVFSVRDTPESFDSDAAWRRGAAKKVVSYNEAAVDYGLDSASEEDDGTPMRAAAAESDQDEIDLVLSHSRDEEHANDPKDIPQVNLVSLLRGLELIISDSM